MPEILERLKMMFRDNFGPAVFLLVAGIIAFTFIGYLLVDYFRTLVMILRIKRRHRLGSREREHRHS